MKIEISIVRARRHKGLDNEYMKVISPSKDAIKAGDQESRRRLADRPAGGEDSGIRKERLELGKRGLN